jgi:large subunit ribosomal protein L25
MGKSYELSATVREKVGKGAARSVRRQDMIPAVIYGHAREPQSLAIPTRDFEKLLERVSAECTVIELNLAGGVARTLIREIQRHPYKKQILHVDFQELVAGEKVTVEIPLVFVGTPEGVRLSGALLEQILHSIEVLVDPANIPNHIDVDVTNLAMGHSLHVRELTLPAGLEVLSDEDATVCAVAAPRAAVEETPAEGVEAIAEPELIRKPKEEEEAK